MWKMVTHSNELPIQFLRVRTKPPVGVVRRSVRPEDGAAVVDDAWIDAELGLYTELASASIQNTFWTFLPLVGSTGLPP
jgi:hypothetical protein